MYDKEQENHIAQIKTLFESKEDENIILGLEILEGLKLFQPLLTHLLIIALYAVEMETRAKASSLLCQNISKNISPFIKQALEDDDSYQEDFIEKTYYKLQEFEELDANLFALLSLNFTKQGGKFCLENKITDPKLILEFMCHDDYLSFEDFNLLFLPKELGELTHLTSLNLNNNRLVDVPEGLEKLKKIDSLYHDNATITTRAKNKLEKYFPKIFAQDYYYEALHLLHQEKNQEALVLLEKASKLDPESDRIWFELGFVLDNLKEYKKAIECYDKSLELKEKKQHLNITSYILNLANKALSLQFLGKQQEKEKVAHKVIEVVAKQNKNVFQKNANFSFSKGLAFYLLGKYEDAQKAYDDAIHIDAHYAVAWYNKACTYAMQRQKKEMLKCLKKAGELRPTFLRTAPDDQDFLFYLEDKDFRKLVNL